MYSNNKKGDQSTQNPTKLPEFYRWTTRGVTLVEFFARLTNIIF